MPKTKTKEPSKQLVIPDTKYAPRQGVFEFSLLSYNHPLPGETGYNKAKDDLVRGGRINLTMIPVHLKDEVLSAKDLTPYDFMTSPITGLRHKEDELPNGCIVLGLGENVSEWITLPPLHVWKHGKWLSDLINDPDFDVTMKGLTAPVEAKIKRALANPVAKDKVSQEVYTYWVVSGEGTPGNYLYRIYDLPEKKCSNNTPHHPMTWPKVKDPYPKKGNSLLWGDDDEHKPAKSYSPPKQTQGTGLPFGVKARCAGCGHWYKIDDLVSHSKLCPREEEQDFAVMCADGCGCTTLDEAAKAKPGFPRAVVKPPAQPTEVPEEAKVEEKPLESMTKKELLAKAQSNGMTLPSGWSKAKVLETMEEVLTKP